MVNIREKIEIKAIVVTASNNNSKMEKVSMQCTFIIKFFKAYGLATHGIRVQPDHRFRIASVTKVLTAASIMRLAEEGRLQLTDRVFGPKGLSHRDSMQNRISLL